MEAHRQMDWFDRLFFTQKGNRWFLLLCAVGGIACFLLFTLVPLPGCLINSTLGIRCPACGATRATLCLLQGDLAGAVYFNPFICCLYLFLLVWGILFVINAFGPPQRYRTPFRIRKVPLLTFFGVMAAFTVIRNLPFYQTIFY